ncbi:MAG: phosphoribosylanthranilate isomerase [bacterium]|nr:phosphoribosylanthranilate isomerase [bacterium]
MSYTQVKVCGITRPKDAQIAAQFGADMIGMIFYRGSCRHIDKQGAREIIDALPPTVERVGLFVNEPIDKLLGLADRLRLDWIQLHGQESDAVIRRIQREGFKVIKAFSIADDTDWKQIASSPADLRLLDNGTGGTGQSFDWDNCSTRKIDRLVLAGGINSQNVSSGIRKFRPLVVDVNSSVESAPGIKSKMKLEVFFKVVNRARTK